MCLRSPSNPRSGPGSTFPAGGPCSARRSASAGPPASRAHPTRSPACAAARQAGQRILVELSVGKALCMNAFPSWDGEPTGEPKEKYQSQARARWRTSARGSQVPFLKRPIRHHPLPAGRQALPPHLLARQQTIPTLPYWLQAGPDSLNFPSPNPCIPCSPWSNKFAIHSTFRLTAPLPPPITGSHTLAECSHTLPRLASGTTIPTHRRGG